MQAPNQDYLRLTVCLRHNLSGHVSSAVVAMAAAAAATVEHGANEDAAFQLLLVLGRGDAPGAAPPASVYAHMTLTHRDRLTGSAADNGDETQQLVYMSLSRPTALNQSFSAVFGPEPSDASEPGSSPARQSAPDVGHEWPRRGLDISRAPRAPLVSPHGTPGRLESNEGAHIPTYRSYRFDDTVHDFLKGWRRTVGAAHGSEFGSPVRLTHIDPLTRPAVTQLPMPRHVTSYHDGHDQMEVLELHEVLVEYETRITCLGEQLTREKERTETLQQEAADMCDRNRRYVTELEHLRVHCNGVEKERDRLAIKNSELVEARAMQSRTVEQLREAYERLEKENTRLQSRVRGLGQQERPQAGSRAKEDGPQGWSQAEVGRLQETCIEARKKTSDLEAELAAERRVVQELRGECERLRLAVGSSDAQDVGLRRASHVVLETALGLPAGPVNDKQHEAEVTELRATVQRSSGLNTNEVRRLEACQEELVQRTLHMCQRRRVNGALSVWKAYVRRRKWLRGFVARMQLRGRRRALASGFVRWIRFLYALQQQATEEAVGRQASPLDGHALTSRSADQMRRSTVPLIPPPATRGETGEKDHVIAQLQEALARSHARVDMMESSMGELQRQKQQHAERIMQRFISLWQHRSLEATLQAWVRYTKERRRQRVVVQRFQGKRRTAQLLFLWSTWKGWVATEKHDKAVIARFALRMRNLQDARCLDLWKEFVDARRRLKSVMHRIVFRLEHEDALRAFNTWMARTREARERAQQEAAEAQKRRLAEAEQAERQRVLDRLRAVEEGTSQHQAERLQYQTVLQEQEGRIAQLQIALAEKAATLEALQAGQAVSSSKQNELFTENERLKNDMLQLQRQRQERAQMITQRFSMRLRNLQAARSLDSWKEFVRARLLLKSTLRRLVFRLEHEDALRAFNTWMQFTRVARECALAEAAEAEKRRIAEAAQTERERLAEDQRKRVAKLMKKLQTATCADTWKSWGSYVRTCKHARRLLARVLERQFRRLQWMSFLRWREATLHAALQERMQSLTENEHVIAELREALTQSEARLHIMESSMNELQRQKQQHAERIMHRFINLWQQRSLEATLKAWMSFTKESRRQRLMVQRFREKWRVERLKSMWGTWKSWNLQEKHDKAVVARFALRMHNLQAARSLDSWKEFVRARLLLRSVMRRIVNRLEHEDALRAFNAWSDFLRAARQRDEEEAAEAERKRAAEADEAERQRLAKLQEAEKARMVGDKRRRAERLIMELQIAAYAEAWEGWTQYVRTCKQARRSLACLLRHKMKQLQSSGFVTWRQNALSAAIEQQRTSLAEKQNVIVQLQEALAQSKARLQLSESSMSELQRQKQQHAERIMHRLITLWQHRSLEVTLKAWARYTKESRRQRLQVQRFREKWRLEHLRALWSTWKTWVSTSKHNKAVVARFALRLRNLQAARSLDSWKEFVSARRLLKAVMHRIVFHLEHEDAFRAFNTWVDHTRDAREREQEAAAEAERQRIAEAEEAERRRAAEAAEAEKARVVQAKRERAAAMIAQLQGETCSEAWRMWIEFVDRRTQARHLMARVLEKKQKMLLLLAALRWRGNAHRVIVEQHQRSEQEKAQAIADLQEALAQSQARLDMVQSSMSELQRQKQQHAEKVMHRLISLWQHRRIEATLQAWIRYTKDCRKRRLDVQRMDNRRRLERLRYLWTAWKDHVVKENHDKAVVARFAFRMRNLQAARCLDTWRQFCYARRLVKSVMRRIVFRLEHEDAMRAFNTWVQFTLDSREHEQEAAAEAQRRRVAEAEEAERRRLAAAQEAEKVRVAEQKLQRVAMLISRRDRALYFTMWSSWVDYVAHQKNARRMLSRVLSHQFQRLQLVSFCRWRQAASSVILQQQRSILEDKEQAIAELQEALLQKSTEQASLITELKELTAKHQLLEGSVDLMQQQKQLHAQKVTARFALRMRNLHISRALESWKEFVHARRVLKSVMRRIVFRLEHEDAMRGFNTWVAFTRFARAREQEAAALAEQKRLLEAQQAESERIAEEKRQRAAKLLMRLRDATRVHAWNSWREYVQLRKHARRLLLRVLNKKRLQVQRMSFKQLRERSHCIVLERHQFDLQEKTDLLLQLQAENKALLRRMHDLSGLQEALQSERHQVQQLRAEIEGLEEKQLSEGGHDPRHGHEAHQAWIERCLQQRSTKHRVVHAWNAWQRLVNRRRELRRLMMSLLRRKRKGLIQGMWTAWHRCTHGNARLVAEMQEALARRTTEHKELVERHEEVQAKLQQMSMQQQRQTDLSATRMIKLWQHRSLNTVFRSWVTYTQAMTCQRTALAVLQSRWRKDRLRSLYSTWNTWVATEKRNKAVVARFALRLRNLQAARSLDSWKEFVQARRLLKSVMRRIVFRLEHEDALRAFNKWTEYTREARKLEEEEAAEAERRRAAEAEEAENERIAQEKRQRAARLLMRLQDATRSHAWNSWLEYAERRRDARKLLMRVLDRQRLLLQAVGFRTWQHSAHVLTLEKHQSALHAKENAITELREALAQSQARLQLMENSMGELQRQKQQHAERIMQRFIGLWHHRSLESTLQAWIAYTKESRRSRVIIQRFSERWRKEHLRSLWGSWQAMVSSEKHDRAVVARFALRMRNLQAARCLDAWKEFLRARRLLKSVMHKIHYRLEHESALRAFNSWLQITSGARKREQEVAAAAEAQRKGPQHVEAGDQQGGHGSLRTTDGSSLHAEGATHQAQRRHTLSPEERMLRVTEMVGQHRRAAQTVTWVAWRHHVREGKRVDALVLQLRRQWQSQRCQRIFGAWVKYVLQKRLLRALLSSVSRRKHLWCPSSAFWRWVVNTADSQKMELAARCHGQERNVRHVQIELQLELAERQRLMDLHRERMEDLEVQFHRGSFLRERLLDRYISTRDRNARRFLCLRILRRWSTNAHRRHMLRQTIATCIRRNRRVDMSVGFDRMKQVMVEQKLVEKFSMIEDACMDDISEIVHGFREKVENRVERTSKRSHAGTLMSAVLCKIQLRHAETRCAFRQWRFKATFRHMRDVGLRNLESALHELSFLFAQVSTAEDLFFAVEQCVPHLAGYSGTLYMTDEGSSSIVTWTSAKGKQHFSSRVGVVSLVFTTGEAVFCQPERHASYCAAVDDIPLSLPHGHKPTLNNGTLPYVLYLPVCATMVRPRAVLAIRTPHLASSDRSSSDPPTPPKLSLLDAVYVSVLVSQLTATLEARHMGFEGHHKQSRANEDRVARLQASGSSNESADCKLRAGRLSVARLSALLNESLRVFLPSIRPVPGRHDGQSLSSSGDSATLEELLEQRLDRLREED